MKRFSLFLSALFACILVSAQSVLPTFSTEESPLWYSVQFKTGEAYLSGPNGAKMRTVAAGSEILFQFIGTAENFTMKSKTGQWVTVSGSNYAMTATKTSAAKLHVVEGSEKGYFEIGRVENSGNFMNQWGGAGVGKDLGEWSQGDTNNQLFFHAHSVQWPNFAEQGAEKPTYYFVRFLKNNNCVGMSVTQGEDLLRIYPVDAVASQQWKLEGTKEKFQLVSKTGKYAIVSNQAVSTTEGGNNPNPLRYSETPDPNGFKLVEAPNGSGFEIVANGKTGKNVLNLWGDPKNANTIGLWNTGGDGNVVAFVDVTKMTYADYKTAANTTYTPENDLTLWYTEPATTAKLYSGGQGYSNWMEYALPIGDGQFGASLFGGVYKDEIQFNEKTLWTGRSTDLSGGGSGYGKYENFGSVFAENLNDAFDFSSEGGAVNYYRQLDLSNATGKVYFEDKNGVKYTREYIASNPARVVAARYTASEPGKLSLRFSMKGGSIKGIKPSYAEDGGTFSGKLETVSYNARFKVVPTGEKATVKATAEGIEVMNADEVLLILAGGTDFDAYQQSFVSNTAQLAGAIEARVNDAAKQTWDELYKKHVDDYKQFFDRVDFQLEGTQNKLTTNTLIDQYNGGNGANALMLERLYFAYGRYLEIASSRGVDLPANLQGIWNNIDKVAWNSDIHSNINVQMNYWPAEPTNLSELHLPFINYIWNMAENHPEWKSYAKRSGQNRGWTCYTENNIFGGGSRFADNYVIANAWYCSHLWQHYRYTLDKEYLKKVFPAMLSATYFWLDRLKLAKDGSYEAPNEWSPEHGPSEDGVAHAQQLVAELFANTLDGIKVLGEKESGISEADLTKLKERYAKLDRGLHTETYDGAWGQQHNNLKKGETILREWKYSKYSVTGDRNHRHMSHLMCMYPFSQVAPGTALFDAAVNSMKLRGDGATGWSMGWKINLWARALDGDHARTILNNALKHANGGSGVFYNLFDSHAPFQIDGNFGACAGIAEMIMQSNSDTIRILPALPTAWKNGHMNGLKAVKDFTVDTSWKDGEPTKVTITNNQGQSIPVLHKNLSKAMVTKNGEEIKLQVNENGVGVISGDKGDVFVIDFTKLPTAISQAANAENAITVQAEGRMLNITGNFITAKVFDLEGRKMVVTNKKQFNVPAAAGNVVLVEVSEKFGKTQTFKVVLAN